VDGNGIQDRNLGLEGKRSAGEAGGVISEMDVGGGGEDAGVLSKRGATEGQVASERERGRGSMRED